SGNFSAQEQEHPRLHQELRSAIDVALLLGAPFVRIFAGVPPARDERERAFDRSVRGTRKACEAAAEAGMVLALQNHNHNSLTRTAAEALRFLQAVDHPNLTLCLDIGQFAGSPGATKPTGPMPPELRGASYLDSIRQLAPMARYVRCKFYRVGPDGS